eukprot:GFYU01000131.1.p1 GENE.GFYU01000131.1~~GFYU01000131.1.p1  ORF type:complete len:425 (+),score=120.23 GFYU01000131.1:153-1427(+)
MVGITQTVSSRTWGPLFKELFYLQKNLKKATLGQCHIEVDTDTMCGGETVKMNRVEFKLVMRPIYAPWEGTEMTFTVRVPAGYPDEPPSFNIDQYIPHCNFDSCGEICLNIFDEYDPNLKLIDYIHAVLWLLYNPNHDDPLNSDFAEYGMDPQDEEWHERVYEALYNNETDNIFIPEYLKEKEMKVINEFATAVVGTLIESAFTVATKPAREQAVVEQCGNVVTTALVLRKVNLTTVGTVEGDISITTQIALSTTGYTKKAVIVPTPAAQAPAPAPARKPKKWATVKTQTTLQRTMSSTIGFINKWGTSFMGTAAVQQPVTPKRPPTPPPPPPLPSDKGKAAATVTAKPAASSASASASASASSSTSSSPTRDLLRDIQAGVTLKPVCLEDVLATVASPKLLSKSPALTPVTAPPNMLLRTLSC